MAGYAVDPLKAVSLYDNVYLNKKLGIMCSKPEGWGYIHVQDFGELKSKQIIGELLEETSSEIFEALEDPICVMTKYFVDTPENIGLFSPTITVNVTPKEEMASQGYVTIEDVIWASRIGVSNILKDFKVIKEYDPYELSKCKFYEFDAEYVFEHLELESPLKVELKVFKAENNGYYYDFNCHQCRAQNEVADAEFEAFKQSIKLL